MQGTMGGLHFSLETVEIGTQKNWLIIGFGYAWIQTAHLIFSLAESSAQL